MPVPNVRYLRPSFLRALRAVAVVSAVLSSAACSGAEGIGRRLRVESQQSLVDDEETHVLRYINETDESWRIQSTCGSPYLRRVGNSWEPVTPVTCDSPAPTDSTLAPGDTLTLGQQVSGITPGTFTTLRVRATFYQESEGRVEVRLSNEFTAFGSSSAATRIE